MNSVFRAFFKNTFEFILHPIRQLFAFFRRVIPGLKWLSNLKPEVLAAVLTFIFLLVVWIITRFATEHGNADPGTQFSNALKVLALIIAISVVLYLFLRVALQPPKSPFPDIDESWFVGLKALEKNGLPIKDLPVYLVLGMRDSKRIRCFMEASGKSFDVEGVTGSGQTLIWYASKDHVFLFLADVGNFSQFTAKSQDLISIHGKEEVDFTNTANIKDFYDVPKHQSSEASEPVEVVDIMKTVRAADLAGNSGQRSKLPEPSAASRPASELKRESARAKVSEEKKRLDHFARLVHRTRTPVCPINGLIANANINVVESYPEELARRLRDDLDGMASELGVICATTIVISGFESDKGFINFAERLIQENGIEFSKSKFGKSYRTWTPPTPEQLEQVAQSAVEEFDHFVHLIFTKRDALSLENVQGNRNLVLFLCRLYSTFLPGLKVLLGKGCGLPATAEDIDFPRFAGCYFVGNDENHDYFLQRVFDRVDENQGELEWTRDSLRREENWTILANVAYLVGLCCLIAVVFLLFYHRSKDKQQTKSSSGPAAVIPDTKPVSIAGPLRFDLAGDSREH